MAAGSKPGERRGGRKKGQPNKATAEIKAIAQRHGSKIIKELARLAMEADTAAARIAASKEVLDRAYGKAPQTIAGDAENPLRLKARIELVVIDPKSDKG